MNEPEYNLAYCEKCVQMTNHLGEICQKCLVSIKLRELALQDNVVAVYISMFRHGQVGYVEMLERLAVHLVGEKKQLKATIKTYHDTNVMPSMIFDPKGYTK